MLVKYTVSEFVSAKGSFISIDKETLVNTIRCNLTKHIGFSQLLQNHYISVWGYFVEELYARLNHWYVRSIDFVSTFKVL